MRQRFALVCLCLILLLPTASVFAFQPVSESLPTLNDLPAIASVPQPNALLANRDWADFTARCGPFLRVEGDPLTGLPRKVMGGIAIPSAKGDADAVRTALLDFTTGYPGLFPVPPADLVPLQIQNRARRWFVTFEQRRDGIAIEGARLDFRLDEQGHCLMIGAALIPVSSPALAMTLTPEQAALSVSKTAPSITLSVASSERRWVAVPGEQGYILHPAWALTLSMTDGHAWKALVDGISGKVYRIEDTRRYFDVTGTLSGDIHPNHYLDTLEYRDFGQTKVLLISPRDSVVTDTDGSFLFTVESADDYDLVGTQRGPWVRVRDFATNDEYIFMGLGNPSAPVDLHFTSVDAPEDAQGILWHVNRIHDWYKALDPEFIGLDYPVPAKVSVTSADMVENAYWDGNGINFGMGGDNAYNFGMFSDIIYHEYTHGVTDKIYGGGLPYTAQSGAISEGLSDYFAATITNDHKMGEGVYRYDSLIVIRDLINTNRFPEDIRNEVHEDSKILTGALWEARESLRVTFVDTLVHFARYGLPDSFEAYLDEMIVMDDDNGTLLDGTPHFFTIYHCFQNHGLGRWRVDITHRGRPDTENTTEPYPVVAQIYSSLPLDMARNQVHYLIGTVEDSVGMTILPDSQNYQGLIPPQPEGTMVRYWFTAQDTFGTRGRCPVSDTIPPFRFFVGQDTIKPLLQHRQIGDQMVAAVPWIIWARARDNLGLASVVVEFRLNGGEWLTRDLWLTDSVQDQYVGLIDPPGVALGDSVEYRVIATDAAAAANRTIVPATGYYTIHVVDGFFFPFTEGLEGWHSQLVAGEGAWEWGTPPVELGLPDTTRCVGTGMSGDYFDNSVLDLVSPAMDLTTWTSATLRFDHVMWAEPTFDGGNVSISTDGGSTYELITPIGGYPRETVGALTGPGFDQANSGVMSATYDLLPYVGNEIILRFTFASDAGLTNLGWFVDNVSIAQTQVLIPPTMLSAQSGHHESVPLTWNHPLVGGFLRPGPVDPTDPAHATRFLGFNLYRRLAGEEYPFTPLNHEAPITANNYNDLDVIDGTTYYYIVTAVYDEGESGNSNEVSAMPYWPRISVVPDSLHAELWPAESLTTILTISNEGNGPLTWNMRETEYPTPFERPTVAPPGVWQFLGADPAEGHIIDYAGAWAQSSVSEVWFRFTSHTPMVWNDYSNMLFMDTDGDSTTGDPTGGIGAEFGLIFGNLPMPQPSNTWLLYYDPSSPYGWSPTGEAEYYVHDDTSAVVGIVLSALDHPRLIRALLVGMEDIMSGGAPIDMMPDGGAFSYSTYNCPWLVENPTSSTTWPGLPAEISVTFNTTGMRGGWNYTYLQIASNDLDQPMVRVPVTLHVLGAGVEPNPAFTMHEPLRAWPNPTTGVVTFPASGLVDQTTVRLSSADGRTIRQVPLRIAADGSATVDMTGLAAGSYLLQAGGRVIRVVVE